MPQAISRRGLITAALSALPASHLLADSSSSSSVSTHEPIRLIANENPYGPSSKAQAAAVDGVANGWQYAFGEIGALRQQLAELHAVTPEHIIVTAGSGEVLKIAALAFCQKGGSVVAAKPTFNLITRYAETLGSEVNWVPLDSSMTHDLDGMSNAVSEQTALVYLCNPNNPTGTMIDGVRVREFITEVSPQAPVIVDEAYLDLHDDAADQTAIPNVLAGESVVVTRTFSKLHGMAGLRIGYAIAAPEIITRFKSLRMTFLSRPGVLAASASLKDSEFLDFSRSRIAQSMKVTTQALDDLKLAYTPSFGNFILFDTGGSVDAFKAAMKDAGINTARTVTEYPGWARVSMGKVEHMEIFAAAARNYFGVQP
jgi:histidinol-phosphate aminotransferase